MVSGNTALGVLGEVNPNVLATFDLNSPVVALWELNLDALSRSLSETGPHLKPFARYPGAIRDLGLLVPAEVPAGRVREIIVGHRLVERAELFDVYTGDNIPAGTKSLAYYVFFQAYDRTLTTEEVNRSLQGLLRTLEREVGASLRS